jgi:hypothetical protein
MPMISSRPPLRDSLWARVVLQDEDAMVHQRNPAYIDEELFYEYRSHAFIPFRANLRTSEVFSGEYAICLMDSALPNLPESDRRLLGENRVLAIAFPAHTMNIFRALDLLFFGHLKKLKLPSMPRSMTIRSKIRSPKPFRLTSRRQHRSQFEVHFIGREWFRIHQHASSD